MGRKILAEAQKHATNVKIASSDTSKKTMDAVNSFANMFGGGSK